MATRGKSAREMQAEIEAALGSRQKRQRRRGLLAHHLGAGGTMGDAMAMTLDDARVAVTCPRELGAVAAFRARDASLPLRSPPDPDGARALICDGRYEEIASGISRP